MYAAERIFETLTYEELYYTLLSIAEEDCYLQEFLDNSTIGDFLYLLEMYKIIFIASDDRILLTPKGEKILQHINQLIVDLDKFYTKLIE